MKKLLWLLLLAPALAQNTVTVTAANIHNGSNGLLSAGTILFQAINAQGQNISYQVGAAGPSFTAPTVCSITNGAITGTCVLPNVSVAAPQNFFFAVTVKNTANVVVLGGPGTAYNNLQPVANSTWCTAAVCDFDLFYPTIPNNVYVLQLPPPGPNFLGGVYSSTCAVGYAVSGYTVQGVAQCTPIGGGSGSSIWGQIIGTLSNQTDLYTYLQTLAPLNGPAFTGAPSAPTPLLTDNSTTIVNSSWVQGQAYAPLASPALTGTPTAPTPLTGDSSTKLATTAWVNAQGYSTGAGNVSGPGSSILNDIALFGGTNGRSIIDAGFGFPLAPAHIGTLLAGSNGLANSAITDTTNAANITSGTLAAARLPNPSLSSLGGVQASAAITHQWLNSLATTGIFTTLQPACGDLTNAAPSCATDTTNASNISGTFTGNVVGGLTGTASFSAGTTTAPSLSFVGSPLGMYLALAPYTWTVTNAVGTGTVVTLTLTNSSGWTFSFSVNSLIDVSGVGAGFNCVQCVVTASNQGAGTLSYSGTGVGPLSSGSVQLYNLAFSQGAHKVVYNALQSSTANAAQNGSIQLGPGDTLTSWQNTGGGYTVTLLGKNTNSSAGDMRAAQVGDTTYGFVTATGAPATINGNLTVTGTITGSVSGQVFPATVSGGVSGAVPCFTATTTEGVSALLAANDLVIGGGAGACPSTVALTTPTPAGAAVVAQRIASGTATLGTSAITNGTCATVVTVAATGVATTDVVEAAFNSDPTGVTGYSPGGGVLYIVKYPTSGNVNFKVCNATAASITPGAITLNWSVVR